MTIAGSMFSLVVAGSLFTFFGFIMGGVRGAIGGFGIFGIAALITIFIEVITRCPRAQGNEQRSDRK
jgi:hypothetical protein